MSTLVVVPALVRPMTSGFLILLLLLIGGRLLCGGYSDYSWVELVELNFFADSELAPHILSPTRGLSLSNDPSVTELERPGSLPEDRSYFDGVGIV